MEEYNEFRRLFEIRIQSLSRAVDFLQERIQTENGKKDVEQQEDEDEEEDEEEEEDVDLSKKRKRY
jgi:NADH:ubiquinone oxidoreductase subunit B-like Fe-S oxidoreductase